MRKDDVIWEIPDQTIKKHEILDGYLSAWFPILRTASDHLLYIDGFSGPNEYVDGRPGSPQIALDAATKNPDLYRNNQLTLAFNENDKRRFEKLQSWAHDQATRIPDYLQIRVTQKDFTEMATAIIQSDAFQSDPAVFAFVDPFGFSKVPMQLLSELTRNRKSELLILFAFNPVNRFSTAHNVDNQLSELFGCDSFMEAPTDDPLRRKLFLIDLYEQQLRARCDFEYISRFEMVRSDGKTSYFLFHCTRHLKGLEVFRNMMWKADPVTGLVYSARANYEGALFGPERLINLDRDIATNFAGQEVTVEDLEKYVLQKTPYKLSHLRKYGLKPLQERGLLTPVHQKRRFEFPHGTIVKIHRA